MCCSQWHSIYTCIPITSDVTQCPRECIRTHPRLCERHSRSYLVCHQNVRRWPSCTQKISTEQDQIRIQNSISIIANWTDTWLIHAAYLNIDICKHMEIGNATAYNNPEYNIPHKNSNITIQTVDKEKDLGIVIDKNYHRIYTSISTNTQHNFRNHSQNLHFHGYGYIQNTLEITGSSEYRIFYKGGPIKAVADPGGVSYRWMWAVIFVWYGGHVRFRIKTAWTCLFKIAALLSMSLYRFSSLFLSWATPFESCFLSLM